QRLRDGLGQGPAQYRSLKEAIDQMKTRANVAAGAAQKKWMLKLGIASFFLGRIKDAATYLRQGDTALAHFYLGRSLTNLDEFEEAHKAFEKAEKSGYTSSQVQLQRAGLFRHQGKYKEARDTLGKLTELASHSAEYHFQNGMIQLEEGQ